jgi:2-dehydro-3-deoxygluconokinase
MTSVQPTSLHSTSASAARVAAIGECMIEVADLGEGRARLGFGGDTLNTAIYLARQGVGIDYHTALGDDERSAEMIEAWREEGIGIGHVTRVPGASPGLYLVRTDAHGERSFQFWRDHSPARRLCALPDWAQRARTLQTYDWLFFSAITLSIVGQEGRDALFAAIDGARAQGVRVAFDSNYRQRHWPDAETARTAILSALQRTDLALPTFDDERALFGDVDPADTLARLQSRGVCMAAIKLGAQGCLLLDDQLLDDNRIRTVPARPVTRVVDTTAAGDAFNAGFLAGIVHGETADIAAQRGHRIASVVIQHPGAIAPREAMPAQPLTASGNAA